MSAEIRRDRWGRPLVVPPGGGEPVPYTRTSTLAKSLDDTTNLTAWKARLTAVGIATNPHLATRVAGVVNKHADPVRGGKRDLNAIVKSACDAAGQSRAADTGTALHELTETLDTGRDLRYVPEQWAEHLDAYAAATAPLEVLEIEQFVVCDDLASAGTFDRLVRLPDGRVVVADLKTGAWDATYPLGVTTQIATYAHGLRYDPGSGERTPLHPDLDQAVGLLIHLPAATKPARCDLYLLDLAEGWKAATTAARVHIIRKWKADDLRQPVTYATEASTCI